MARKDVSTLRDEAAAAVEKGKLDKALEVYAELEQRQPKDASWPKRIGDVYRKQGDNDRAITAYVRAIDCYVQAGFAVQAIAVCKLVLAIDPEHATTLEKLTKIAESTSAVRPGGVRKPVTPTPTRVRVGTHDVPKPEAAQPAEAPKPPPPPPKRPPPPPPPPPSVSPREVAEAADEPARIHAPVPKRSAVIQAPVVLPPGAGLDAVALAGIVPGATRVENDDGSESGMVVIPLDDDELELIVDDDELGGSAIDLAIADIDVSDITAPPVEPPPLDLEARRALLTTPLLAGLPPKALESLAKKLALVELARGAALFQEGDPGATLYVISEGEVIVDHGGVELARLGPGAFFGEVALVTDLPRSAGIRASMPTELLAIDRDVVRALVAEHPVVFNVILKFVRDRLVERVLRISELFRPFSPEEQVELQKKFELVEVDSGAAMITQGKRADGLYVVLAGKVEVWRDGEQQPAAQLGPGEVFGEMSLLAGGGATAHVKPITRVLALRMPAKTFREVIMTHPQVLQYVGELAERRAPKADAPEADFVDLHLDLL